MIGKQPQHKLDICTEEQKHVSPKNSQNIGRLQLSPKHNNTNLNKSNDRQSKSSQRKIDDTTNSYTQRYKAKQMHQQNDLNTSKKTLQENIRKKALSQQIYSSSQQLNSDKHQDQTKPVIAVCHQPANTKKQCNSVFTHLSKNSEDITKFSQDIMIKQPQQFQAQQDSSKQTKSDKHNVDVKQRQKSSSCIPQQSKAEQQLIYNKTLYKNDEYFPSHEQISKKIADLVIQKFIKQIKPQNSITEQTQESTSRAQISSIYQDNQTIVELVKQFDTSYKNFNDQDITPVSSYQTLHRMSETYQSSTQTISNQKHTKQQQNNLKYSNNTSQQVSISLSPKSMTCQNQLFTSPNNNMQKQKQQQTSTINNEIKDQDIQINMNWIDDFNKNSIRRKSKQSLSPAQNQRNSSNGSRGSPRFNEMRNQQKHRKSMDLILSKQNLKNETLKYWDQLKQIEALQSLIDSPKNQHDILIQAYTNRSTTNKDAIEEIPLKKYNSSSSKLNTGKQFREDIKPQSAKQRVNSDYQDRNKKFVSLSPKSSENPSEQKLFSSQRNNSQNKNINQNSKNDLNSQKYLNSNSKTNILQTQDLQDTYHNKKYVIMNNYLKQTPTQNQKKGSQQHIDNNHYSQQSRENKNSTKTLRQDNEMNISAAPTSTKKEAILNNMVQAFQRCNIQKEKGPFSIQTKQNIIQTLQQFQAK